MPLNSYGKFKYIDLKSPKEIKSIIERASACNCFIAGGAIRSIYQKEPIRDLDIFCRTKIAFVAMKAGLLELGLIPEFENPMLARFKKYDETSEKKIFEYSVDVVVPREGEYLLTVGTPEQVISHFDFTVSRAAIMCPSKALVDENFEQDCKTKQLKIIHIVCPLSTVQRIGKYAKKGYTIGTKEVLRLFIEYKKRNNDKLEELFDKNNLSSDELTQLMNLVYID